MLDKKQLHQVVNKKKTETIIGKSEKINLNKSSIAMMENKENICEEHIDQIKKPNIQKIDHRYFIKSSIILDKKKYLVYNI